MTEYLSGHDTGTDEGLKDALDYAYALATKYGEGAAALSAEMYDAMARLSGVEVPPAVPAATADYGEVAKTVQGIMKWSELPESVGSGVGRLVKTAGVDTTMQNALRDGAQWAWIPSGDSCAFCLMLASNGWQNASKKAIKNGHAEHIHNNCDCNYAVRFDDKTTVAGYDPASIKAQFDATEGDTWDEKVKNMRREHDAAKRGLSESVHDDILKTHKTADLASQININSLHKQNERELFVVSKDVTEEYLTKATPGIGAIDREVGFTEKDHDAEIAFAKWLHNTLGGDILQLKDTSERKCADYLWNDKLWDLKTIASQKYNTVDQHIRDANKQIMDNRGGIMIDISKNPLSAAEMCALVEKSIVQRSIQTTDVLIKNNDSFKIFRIN